jgi:membrane-bound lytic murein transglycosylase B
MPRRPILSHVAALVVACAIFGSPARAQPDFAQFLAALWPDARAAGVSRASFDAAFAGISPDPQVIAAAGRQAEFNQTIGAYVAARVTPGRIAAGQRLAARHAALLARLERQTGVGRGTILAVWAMESNFGADSGGADIIRTLATFACCTGQRPGYFRDELIAALTILEAHDIAPRAMKGSWAGAMGQTQFMPSSFLAFARDGDGDGKRDIWGSAPDALASIATYLQHHDWDAGARWGYEVTLPRSFDFGRITALEGKPAADWLATGLARADGRPVPDPRAKAWLLLPAGAKGPAFLTLANYWAIKTYNVSDAYTLAVGLLADRIEGGPPLTRPFPKGEQALPRASLVAMQTKLVALGYKLDPIDGKVGPATRLALRGWQASAGLTADGYPTADLLRRLGATP